MQDKLLAGVSLMDAAYVNYYRYYKYDKDYHDFWKWIDPESLDYNHEPPGWLVTPEQYNKIAALAGPYYHALMKASEAREDEKWQKKLVT